MPMNELLTHLRAVLPIAADAEMQQALALARDVYLRMRGKDAPRSDFEKVCVALLRANGEEVT